MEEDEYRSTYQSVNEIRCIYEKALNSRRLNCSHMRRIFLADRECAGCQTEAAVNRCTRFLNQLRNKARFALQLTTIDGPLPHNKEIRVQIGGFLGLQALMGESRPENAPNPFEILNRAEARYGSVDAFPYTDIMPSVAQTRGRQRRTRSRQD